MVVQLPPEHEHEAVPADVEAGVIDEARARHRRERWGGAVLATLAIIAGLVFGPGGGGGGAASPGLRHGGRPPAGAQHSSAQLSGAITHVRSVRSFGLLAPEVGWVATATSFYLTHDGGRRWRLLSGARGGAGPVQMAVSGTMPGLMLPEDLGSISSPSANVLAVSFLSGRHGSPSCGGRGSGVGGMLALSRDAGKDWVKNFLPGCGLVQSLSFVNADLGYAVSTDDAHDSALYRTDDGGARWKLVSRFPAPMTVSFGNRSDGLAFVTPNTSSAAAVLYRTDDAGHRWRKLSICGDRPDPTFTVYCEPPVSFGRRGVVLAIAQDLSSAHPDHTYLYTTSDAGLHWTRHAVPPLESPEMPAFSAPDARDVFVYSMNGVLHSSTNGGHTWSSFREPQFRALEQMQFITARYGWLLSPHGFDYSSDGGRSWQPVGTR